MNFTKWMLVMLAALIMTAGAVSQAFAREDLHQEFELSGFAAGVFPDEDDQDSTVYFGGRFIYNFNEQFGAGIESGYMSFEQEAEGFDFGDAQGVPLLADLVVRFPVDLFNNALVPYIVGGVGVTFWDFDESSDADLVGFDVDNDAAFTAKAGLGADYYLTENFAIFVEGGYSWSDWDGDVSLLGFSESTTVDTDMAYAGGGIKIAY